MSESAGLKRAACADKQYCEEYKADEIEAQFGLSKERLALLAMLLGSDYTEGVAGIGIVNAMETLLVFPTLAKLADFKEWLERPDFERFVPLGKRAARVAKSNATRVPPPTLPAPVPVLWAGCACHAQAVCRWTQEGQRPGCDR